MGIANADPAAERQAARFDSEAGMGGSAERRPLILMVDDNPHHCEIYGRMLCYNGFDVVCAGDGAAGLRAAQRRGPDLVLLDLMMPGMDALDVCRQLKAGGDQAAPRVIVLSSRSAREWEGRTRAAGADAYLEKPLSAVQVLHAVEDLVGRPPLPGTGRPPEFLAG